MNVLERRLLSLVDRGGQRTQLRGRHRRGIYTKCVKSRASLEGSLQVELGGDNEAPVVGETHHLNTRARVRSMSQSLQQETGDQPKVPVLVSAA